MLPVRKLLLIPLSLFLIFSFKGFIAQQEAISRTNFNLNTIMNKTDLKKLFPTTPEEIKTRASHYQEQAVKDIAAIIAIKPEVRTFTNTIDAFDTLAGWGNLALFDRVISTLFLIHPDEAMRTAAKDQHIQTTNFVIDNITNNKQLYDAIQQYATGPMLNEELTTEQRYLVNTILLDFKRKGLHLPDEQCAHMRTLQKEIADLITQFSANINSHNKKIEVPPAALAGLAQDTIDAFPKNADGLCMVGMDYPTYIPLMEQCTVANTRKLAYKAYVNRAYPANEPVLSNLLAKRNELAKLLGYQTFAHYEIEDQMAQSPEIVRQFIEDLLVKATTKTEQEIAQFKDNLPNGVTLTADGKFQPWDIPFTKAHYKKEKFDIKESDIAQYFPMEKTVKALLGIYQEFFDLTFKETPITGLWHDDVTLVEAYRGEELLGYLLLDLYPRPDKYTHACCCGIIPTVAADEHESFKPAVTLVIANMPRSTSTKPSLLTRADVKTFFHEFGHAIHYLLSNTKSAMLAGFDNVKTDFVEMPSQMLEEWLTDKEMLKRVSCHYITGKPLSDEQIDNINAVKKFDSGLFVTEQLCYSLESLDAHVYAETKNPYTVMQNIHNRIRTYVVLDPENRSYAAFGHLGSSEYASKYYGYMWSRVFAQDMFAHIQKYGLVNPEIGNHYAQQVLSKGGSMDPNELIYNFLGRAPTQEAFLKELELV